jgi:hypothetical protein
LGANPFRKQRWYGAAVQHATGGGVTTPGVAHNREVGSAAWRVTRAVFLFAITRSRLRGFSDPAQNTAVEVILSG